ncbi:hypothetical protein ACFRCW_46790 [Streptomyces sp. NPDC056653]|uniref:hypothetical protein n=1 Tax=Streptomyces sp. NPDC056653 TaxID=3345894 RepID=UPI0036B7D650
MEFALQAEDLSMGGGEPLLQIADLPSAGVAFVSEGLCQGLDHRAVAVRCGVGKSVCLGVLLTAQGLDAASQVGVAVEKVEADTSGSGDRSEVDL